LHWKETTWICVKSKVKVGFLTVDIFGLSVFFLYAIKCMLIFGVELPIRYPFHEIWVSLRLNLRWILYDRQSEDVYRQKSYFHFRFNTNSGGFFPMQSFFYLKPQGHQIWAYNYPKICRFLLTFSILQYLIRFIFYPTM
jgi:hypothetical protein